MLPCRQEQQVFNANGFDFKELEDGQVQLTAVPFSKEAVFGPQDVHELLHMLVHGEGQAFKMQTQQSTQHSQPSDSAQATPRASTKIVRPSRCAHLGHDCAGRYTLTSGPQPCAASRCMSWPRVHLFLEHQLLPDAEAMPPMYYHADEGSAPRVLHAGCGTCWRCAPVDHPS